MIARPLVTQFPKIVLSYILFRYCFLAKKQKTNYNQRKVKKKKKIEPKETAKTIPRSVLSID
jgi:hypothetical protein